MSYTDLLLKAITYKNPETIPVSVNILPAFWKKYPNEIKDITSRYPQFFGDLGEKYNYETYTPATYHEGRHIDEWGCVWMFRESGRLVLAPAHLLEPEVPLENVEAFVDTIKEFGNRDIA